MTLPSEAPAHPPPSIKKRTFPNHMMAISHLFPQHMSTFQRVSCPQGQWKLPRNGAFIDLKHL